MVAVPTPAAAPAGMQQQQQMQIQQQQPQPDVVVQQQQNIENQRARTPQVITYVGGGGFLKHIGGLRSDQAATFSGHLQLFL